jgi:hypothetical protein
LKFAFSTKVNFGTSQNTEWTIENGRVFQLTKLKFTLNMTQEQLTTEQLSKAILIMRAKAILANQNALAHNEVLREL